LAIACSAAVPAVAEREGSLFFATPPGDARPTADVLAQAEIEGQDTAQTAAEDAATSEAARLAEEAEAALAACLETAGAPSAQVPISETAQRVAFEALRAALPACRVAVELSPEAGGPLYHLATAAQAQGDHRAAQALYRRAAEAGIGAAYTRLGDYANFGIGPVRTDLEAAVAAYRAAADLGDPAGMATLAFMYRLGRGVSRDPARMIALFEQAAAAGYHFAQLNLGRIYLTGEGVPGNADAALGVPDPRAAVPLLTAAARSGNLEAARDLAVLYAEGAEGVSPNPSLRFRWTDRAARSGHPEAIAARAYLLEQGIGTPRDPEAAAAGYIEALETGEIRPEALRDAGGDTPPRWDRDTAMAFQRLLQARGLYNGAIDGIVGGGTLAGARALAD
jgi:TPR repeat protein